MSNDDISSKAIMRTARAANKRVAGREIREGSIVLGTAIVLIGSTVGPDWLHSPADPKTGTPSVAMDFSALRVATEGGPSAVQTAYFGWLSWMLFVGVIVLGALTVRSASRLWAAAGLVAGLMALFFSVLAIKGPLTWSQTAETLPNIRLGGYMVLVGLSAMLVFSAFRLFAPRTAPPR
ncbi:hypothetical protein [Nocardia aurea]|uniref:hypothetical protein n=1 Tax=Nocardia aurea TaxID=2144174 RepID=UPI0013009A04|nr:hypothetical protein [Nocardia aurea]